MATTDGTEQRVVTHLDELQARYRQIRIDPAHANTAIFCQRYGYPAETSANCIVVASRTGERRHVACLVPATRQVDVNRVVRRRMGVRKASFAPPEETEELTGMLTDGVTPFGLPAGPEGPFCVYVAPEVMQHERVIVGGGSRSLKIEVDPEVFARMPGAEVVDGLARTPPAGNGP